MIIRILADDLTGALDTAAPFTALTGPIATLWDDATPIPASGARDMETREAFAAQAALRCRGFVPELTAADIAFKKIDSVLRGSPIEELDACLGNGIFASCILAPAFPAQGRVTIAGRQHVRSASDAPGRPVGLDLAARLRAKGHSVDLYAAGRASPCGAGRIGLYDAQSDHDLAGIVAAGRASPAPVLWCGSAGLARALAPQNFAPPTLPAGRMIVINGSDHAMAQSQVEHLAQYPGIDCLRVDNALNLADRNVWARMQDDPVALLDFSFAPSLARQVAAQAIATALAGILPKTPPPARLIIGGGETLLAACRALSARSLQVIGEAMPGVAVSRIAGGPWDQVIVLSRSGGFGSADLLARLTNLSSP